MRRYVNDVPERKTINLQFIDFHYARKLFFMEEAKDCRESYAFGRIMGHVEDRTPNLKEVCYSNFEFDL